MLIRARRTITKNGNSRTVVIPREFLERLHLMLGDGVLLEMQDDGREFKVRPAESHQSGVRAVRSARAPREVSE